MGKGKVNASLITSKGFPFFSFIFFGTFLFFLRQQAHSKQASSSGSPRVVASCLIWLPLPSSLHFGFVRLFDCFGVLANKLQPQEEETVFWLPTCLPPHTHTESLAGFGFCCCFCCAAFIDYFVMDFLRLIWFQQFLNPFQPT